MDRDSGHLLDILSSARMIRTYMKDVVLDEFLRDTQLQDSVIRRLEIIGEAAGRVSPQFQEEHAEIPWSEMRGMRNRMIHRYDDIDTNIVWDTAQEDIPHLLALIEPLVLPGPNVLPESE